MGQNTDEFFYDPFQRFPQGHPESQGAQQKPRRLSHADIPAADAEGQLHPSPQQADHEQAVAESGQPWAQGPQQLIDQAQPHPHEPGGGKPARGDGNRRHLNRRLAQLPRCRGSS